MFIANNCESTNNNLSYLDNFVLWKVMFEERYLLSRYSAQSDLDLQGQQKNIGSYLTLIFRIIEILHN